jgi:hypothetical protein
MFLKFLDDIELIREVKAKLGRQKFRPAFEAPYRWRDWAAKEDGITGRELTAFINNEETTRPDGSKGAELLSLAAMGPHRPGNCAAFDELGRIGIRDQLGNPCQGSRKRVRKAYSRRDREFPDAEVPDVCV